MVVCCAVPLLIVAALPFFKFNAALKLSILNIAPLICPIMMIFMIPMMIKGMNGGHSHTIENQRENTTRLLDKEKDAIKLLDKNNM
jgi:ABC-type transport system involved in cytochrome bd biosynthesis fused ATPase/permease subunit